MKTTLHLISNKSQGGYYCEVKNFLFIFAIVFFTMQTLFIGGLSAQCDPVTVIGVGTGSTDNAAKLEAILEADNLGLKVLCPLGCKKTECQAAIVEYVDSYYEFVSNEYHVIWKATEQCNCTQQICLPIGIVEFGLDEDPGAAETKAKNNAIDKMSKAKCPIGCVKGTPGTPTVGTPTQVGNLYSVTASISCSCNNFRIEDDATNLLPSNRVYPNPSDGHANVQYISTTDGSNVILTLYNLMGKELLLQNLPANKGVNTFAIDASNVDSGIYLLVINDSGKVTSMKMIIDK